MGVVIGMMVMCQDNSHTTIKSWPGTLHGEGWFKVLVKETEMSEMVCT